MQHTQQLPIEGSDETARWVIALRHVVGMMIVALTCPDIYRTTDKVYTWGMTWASPLLWAGILYGLGMLFFTKKVKRAGPKNFILLAWVLLVIYIGNEWRLLKTEPRQARSAVTAPASSLDIPIPLPPAVTAPASSLDIPIPLPPGVNPP